MPWTPASHSSGHNTTATTKKVEAEESQALQAAEALQASWASKPSNTTRKHARAGTTSQATSTAYKVKEASPEYSNPLCKLSRATVFVDELSTEADAGIDLGGGVTQLPIEDEDIIEIEEEEEVDEEEVEEEEEEEKEVHFTSTWKAFLGQLDSSLEQPPEHAITECPMLYLPPM